MGEFDDPTDDSTPPKAESAPTRASTGVVSFGDDWPGLFLRGDDAHAYGVALRDLLYGGRTLESRTTVLKVLLSHLQSSDEQSYVPKTQLRPYEQCIKPSTMADVNAEHVVTQLEAIAALIRVRGVCALVDGYHLRDLAVECGWKAPKPGLEPEELKAIVRLARAAPSDDVGKYVDAMLKDISAWTKASRADQAASSLLAALGMSAIGFVASSLFRKPGAKK